MVFRPGPAWWVKIGDFGISKRLEGETDLRTVIGTRAYMAPELLHHIAPEDEDDSVDEADFTYTAAVDIWALGAIVFQMITGKQPFQGRQLRDFVVRGGPFPLGELHGTGASPECCDFIENCMRASPRKRLLAVDAQRHPWIAGHEYIDDAGYASDTRQETPARVCRQ